MATERINKRMTVTKQEVKALFSFFDKSLTIEEIAPMTEGMSNTGYMVRASGKKYLLKLYSNATDQTEAGAYAYLQDKIHVPGLCYYDGSKRMFPFAYTITEFLEGMTLREYIRENRDYPLEIAFEIGKMCAVINRKKYRSSAFLDRKLEPVSPAATTRESLLHMLKSKPGAHLQKETAHKLERYIAVHEDLFHRIDSESVLCHGDLNYGNILLSNGKVYLIDFEFAYAGSKYHDIGHFFRRQDDEIQARIHGRVYEAFANGYQSASAEALPPDWLQLAQLCDIKAMLCLLNHDKIPDGWVEEIERDILSAMADDLRG